MKKMVVLVLCVALACVCMWPAAVQAAQLSEAGTSGIVVKAYKPETGDVNMDENIDVVDIVVLKKHVVGIELLSAAGMQAADVDGIDDGFASDLVALKKILLGISL